MFSESALKVAEKRQISETAQFGTEYLCDFNHGGFNYDRKDVLGNYFKFITSKMAKIS